MTLRQFIKLPSTDEAGLTECAVESANKRVTEVLYAEKSLKKKIKEQVLYSDKDRASTGTYAARALIHLKYKYTW